jgi:hypothetical protein
MEQKWRQCVTQVPFDMISLRGARALKLPFLKCAQFLRIVLGDLWSNTAVLQDQIRCIVDIKGVGTSAALSSANQLQRRRIRHESQRCDAQGRRLGRS